MRRMILINLANSEIVLDFQSTTFYSLIRIGVDRLRKAKKNKQTNPSK